MIAGVRRSAWVRVAPFAVFMLPLALRGAVSEAAGGLVADPRWLYALGAGATALVLALYWREYGELARPNWPTAGEALLGVATGLVVFALWIRLDAPWMQIGSPAALFVPVDTQGRLGGP